MQNYNVISPNIKEKRVSLQELLDTTAAKYNEEDKQTFYRYVLEEIQRALT